MVIYFAYTLKNLAQSAKKKSFDNGLNQIIISNHICKEFVTEHYTQFYAIVTTTLYLNYLSASFTRAKRP